MVSVWSVFNFQFCVVSVLQITFKPLTQYGSEDLQHTRLTKEKCASLCLCLLSWWHLSPTGVMYRGVIFLCLRPFVLVSLYHLSGDIPKVNILNICKMSCKAFNMCHLEISLQDVITRGSLAGIHIALLLFLFPLLTPPSFKLPPLSPSLPASSS